MSRRASCHVCVLQHLKSMGCHLTRQRLTSLFNGAYLLFLFGLALALTLLITTGRVEAGPLLQSPDSSPVLEPAAEQPVDGEPVLDEPIEAPIEQAPAAEPAVEQPAAELTPVEQPAAEQPAVEQPAVEQPIPEPTFPAAPVEPALVEPAAPEQTLLEPVRPEDEEILLPEEEESSGNLILDRAEFVDTVIVSGAYVWLCCGVGLFLIVPLFLLFVYIRGRSKMINSENF